jgi:hypothetical protein
MAAVLKSSLMLEGSGSYGSSAEDVTEGTRRATVETSSGAPPPDPEVAAAPSVLRQREASSAGRGGSLQGQRTARCIPASRAHLFLDAGELAQAGGQS